EDQNVLSRRCELPGERAAARAAADDDDVVALIHAGPLKADAALHDTAIREDRCRGEIACAISSEEPDHTGDLLRSRHASQRYCRIQLRELGRIFHRAEIDRRCHRTWTHADHKDVVAGEFDTGGAREHAHAALGKAISGIAGHWPVLVHRTDVDDAA